MFSKIDILFLYARLYSIFGKIISFIDIASTTTNWWSVLAVYLGIKESAYATIRRTSIRCLINKNNWLSYYCLRKIAGNKIRLLGKYHYDNDSIEYCDDISKIADSDYVLVEVSGLKFITPFLGIYQLDEIFLQNMYSQPSYNNSTVLDVGAFIGDSSLFFAIKGAKHVIAFEPIPPLFKCLKKNITINCFEGVIIPRNEAISDRKGTIDMAYIPTDPNSSGINIPKDKKVIFYKTDTASLSDLLIDLGHLDILKIDCEGCEEKILRQIIDDDLIKYFGMLIVEVHSNVHDFIKMLNDVGFKINKLRQCGTAWILWATYMPN